MGSRKGEGELLQEFSPGYSCYRNQHLSASAIQGNLLALIVSEVKWVTRKWKCSAPAHPHGMGAPWVCVEKHQGEALVLWGE